jgi:heme-degrading monooxygenase HmoA
MAAMHARVTSVSVQPDKVDETIRIYEASIKPAIMSQKGAQRVYLMINRASGKGISVTIWESEADGVAYESTGSYREQVAKVASFFSAPPSLETYDIAVTG